MCAILDNNVIHEVFSSSDQKPTRGVVFLEWIEEGKSVLIIGGELTKELYKTKNAHDWIRQGLLAGVVINVDTDEEGVKIEKRVSMLQQQGSCHSNDPHIIVLAQISGARILYTKDKELMEDFKNKRFIDPKGKIYPPTGSMTKSKFKDWLNRNRGLCNKKGSRYCRRTSPNR